MCGLKLIANGQYEATWAQDLNKAQSMMFVYLSQTLKAVIPVNIHQIISLFGDTGIVSLKSITNLFGIGRATLCNPDWWELTARSTSPLAPCSGS